MNSLLETFEKKRFNNPVFIRLCNFQCALVYYLTYWHKSQLKLFWYFFLWKRLFGVTCFLKHVFFSQNNVIWDLDCLFMMPKRCFFFTLNYIWFRKYHWQIRPSKKIEHLNISMPHFQKGHKIKFFLGQTSCMICSVIITKQHGCTMIFVKKIL